MAVVAERGKNKPKPHASQPMRLIPSSRLQPRVSKSSAEECRRGVPYGGRHRDYYALPSVVLLEIVFAPDLGPNPMMNDVYMYTSIYPSVSVSGPPFFPFHHSSSSWLAYRSSFAVTEAIDQSIKWFSILFFRSRASVQRE
uniref:Uncharacterized protein n=2 Tax=Aegilops tauschii subsp. strangulata TaxID=200361 RepID=A0A453MT39_AEGTS